MTSHLKTKASALTVSAFLHHLSVSATIEKFTLLYVWEMLKTITYRLHLDKNSAIYSSFTEFSIETLSSQGNRRFPMRNPTMAAGCLKLAHTADSTRPVKVTNENENISVPFRLPICISVNTDTRIEVISGIPSTSSGFSGTSSHS